jgi:hypothetical protein
VAEFISWSSSRDGRMKRMKDFVEEEDTAEKKLG